jgi:threonine dehydratase
MGGSEAVEGMPTLGDVQRAAERIAGAVVRTPLVHAARLSQQLGIELHIKLESMQATGSFKERGALSKLLTLGEEARRRGVVTVSAGNHAQAVALHAARLGIPATVVMPVTTPFVKVGNTEALGATVVQSGETLADARLEALAIAEREGLALVHPYDDPQVIAGQGTIALEMLAAMPDLDCLLVPVGGGGLISGIAIAARAIKPGIEIVGVEAASYPSLHAALKGEEARCGGLTLADGIAVKTLGTLTLPLVRALVDELLLADDEAIEAAVYTLAVRQKTIAEGAGAAGLAALLRAPERFRGRKVGLVLSGGNIDPRILASILIRGLERDDKIVSLRLTVDDQPGTLGRIASLLGEAGANILSISHRRILLNVPARGSSLDLLIETRDAPHSAAVIERLRAAGYDVKRLGGPSAADFMTD